MPTDDLFEHVKVDVPEPKEGEFLIRNIWMSVDPYMRGRMRSPEETKSYINSLEKRLLSDVMYNNTPVYISG